MKKHSSTSLRIVMPALMLALYLTGCATTGVLEGAWKADYDIEPRNVFEFRGNRFTYTQYDGVPTARGGVSILNESLCTEDEIKNRQTHQTDQGQKYYRIVSKGTFSVSDETVKFTLSDGTVQVSPFSLAEEKINIDNMPFIRR